MIFMKTTRSLEVYVKAVAFFSLKLYSTLKIPMVAVCIYLGAVKLNEK